MKTGNTKMLEMKQHIGAVFRWEYKTSLVVNSAENLLLL